MDARAAQRLRRAHRRLWVLRHMVRWWGRATAAQRLAVLGEVRDSWPRDTTMGATECNWYDGAGDYLAAHGWGLSHGAYRRALAS